MSDTQPTVTAPNDDALLDLLDERGQAYRGQVEVIDVDQLHRARVRIVVYAEQGVRYLGKFQTVPVFRLYHKDRQRKSAIIAAGRARRLKADAARAGAAAIDATATAKSIAAPATAPEHPDLPPAA